MSCHGNHLEALPLLVDEAAFPATAIPSHRLVQQASGLSSRLDTLSDLPRQVEALCAQVAATRARCGRLHLRIQDAQRAAMTPLRPLVERR
eukprot:350318-Chlamydomonas_euryale.AAC.22